MVALLAVLGVVLWMNNRPVTLPHHQDAAKPPIAKSVPASDDELQYALSGFECSGSDADFKSVQKRYLSYNFRLSRIPDPKGAYWSECKGEVLDKEGRVLWNVQDHSVYLSINSDKDFNNDGIHDAEVVTWTGGAHCCFLHHLLTFSPTFVQLHVVAADVESLEIQRDAKGLKQFRVPEIYDYFDGLCYACSPSDYVLLRFQGARIEDRTSSICAISKSEKSDPPQMDLDAFLNSNGRSIEFGKEREWVLSEVFQRIACGQRQTALAFLKSHWPRRDFRRIHEEVSRTPRRLWDRSYFSGELMQRLSRPPIS